MDRPLLLLVDDSPVVLESLRRFLEQQGFAVVTLAHGRQATTVVEDVRPAAALVDVEMPEVSGLEVMRELRGTFPDMPVVALTLQDAGAYREAAGRAGASAFVSKSALEQDLIPALLRLLDGS